MIEKIGNNAGSVWTVLNAAGGRKSLKELKKLTKLTEKDMYAALGWLAREDKIYFTEEEAEIFVALR
ncbi:MAG: winged helix-turn-helix domain-containing protein [Bacteroidales bacterium]|nr:winged helix-turn-helix domain-containing protein [Bacteroidales bacterium]